MIELILYMGIFSILLLVLLQIFSTVISTHLESQATSSIDQEGNFILSRLTYDIHRAQTVSATPSILNLTSSGGLNETYQIATVSGQTQLQLTDNGVPNRVSTPDVTPNITFTILGNGSRKSVQINLTLTSNVKRPGGLIDSQSFTTTVQTRP